MRLAQINLIGKSLVRILIYIYIYSYQSLKCVNSFDCYSRFFFFWSNLLPQHIGFSFDFFFLFIFWMLWWNSNNLLDDKGDLYPSIVDFFCGFISLPRGGFITSPSYDDNLCFILILYCMHCLLSWPLPKRRRSLVDSIRLHKG